MHHFIAICWCVLGTHQEATCILVRSLHSKHELGAYLVRTYTPQGIYQTSTYIKFLLSYWGGETFCRNLPKSMSNIRALAPSTRMFLDSSWSSLLIKVTVSITMGLICSRNSCKLTQEKIRNLVSGCTKNYPDHMCNWTTCFLYFHIKYHLSKAKSH